MSRKTRNDWLDRPAQAGRAVTRPSANANFFLFTRGRATKRRPFKDYVLPLVFILAALALGLAMRMEDADSGTIAITLGLLILSGVALAEGRARRKWQRDVSARLDKLASLHDRLVREVARGRSDLTQMREGLAMTATRIGAERGTTAFASPEARMIETIVAQLSALGHKPESAIDDEAAASILSLEMNPPPRPPAEANAMEQSLSAPGGQRSEGMILRLIEQAVRDDAIDLFLQPVVSLPQRKLRMYEAFARLRAGEGQHVAASHYIETAQREKLTPAIDNLLLLRCLQMVRRTAEGEALPFVLNISGATLADAGFTGDLLTFLSDNRTMAARLIFELTQDEAEALPPSSAAVLAGLSKLGCVFSMDGVRRRELNLDLLRRLHIRYIKLDAAWLVREGAERAGAARVLRFKQQLDAAGIDLIVERIENEESLRTILDFNIDFGQGYLFGKPDTASSWVKNR